MKNEEPILVAIKCLVYNHESYLRDCLDGFVMQKTNFRFVAIVHDDVSTDNSAAIIQEYAEKYPGIFCPIYETENQYSKGDGSLDRVLDEAINTTDAKYVATCEGDDYWIDPLKLQKQVDFLESHPDVGLCYTDYNQQYDSNPNIICSMFEQQHHYRPETYELHLLKPGYLAPMTWVYRRELSGFINDAVVSSDGTYAYMLEFMKNSKVAYMPDVTATYRSHKGSASSPIGHVRMFKYMKGVFDTQVYYSEKYPCGDDMKKKIRMRGYLDILPVAIMADCNDFVEDARDYLESQDLRIDLIIRELRQGEMRKRSKAYQIGKALLKPFRWLKNV